MVSRTQQIIGNGRVSLKVIPTDLIPKEPILNDFCPKIIFFFRNSKTQNLFLNIWHWFINFIYMIWLVSKLNKNLGRAGRPFRNFQTREKKISRPWRAKEIQYFICHYDLSSWYIQFLLDTICPHGKVWAGKSIAHFVRSISPVTLTTGHFANGHFDGSEVEVLDGKFFQF